MQKLIDSFKDENFAQKAKEWCENAERWSFEEEATRYDEYLRKSKDWF